MKVKQKKDAAAKEKYIKKTKLSFKPPQKQKVAIVAQEFKYSRLLAGNEKKTRDKVLKALKKWLINCFEKGHEFNEEDFVRLWKGLFYTVWMADKPLVQEELCESIAAILDQFPPQQFNQALMFFKAGLRVLATEWYGIDHHRMDKFLMLVRRMLRASFRCLKRSEWSLEACENYAQTLSGTDGVLASKTPVFARNALSMLLHIADCYLEELSKVSNGSLPEDALVALVRPFSHLVLLATDLRVSVAARQVFNTLLRQTDEAIEGNARHRAWIKMGCPEGGPDALEPLSDDGEHPTDEEDESEDADAPLDPRAGRVDVLLSPLPVPAVKLAAMLTARLKELARVPGHNVAASATRVKAVLKRFEALACNENPLPWREVPTADRAEVRTDGLKSALELQTFEQTLVRDPVKEALKGAGRRERKRLLALARSGLDVTSQLKQLTEKTSNGEWQVEIENLHKTEAANKLMKKKRKLSKEPTATVHKKVKLVVKNKNLKPVSPKISQNNQSLLNGDAKTNEKVKNYNKQDKVKLIIKQNKIKSTKKSSNNQVTKVHSVENKETPLKIKETLKIKDSLSKIKDNSPKIRIISKENEPDFKVCQNLKPSLNSSKPGLNKSKSDVNSSKPGLNSSKPGLNSSKPGLNSSKPGLNSSKPGLNSSKPGLNSSKPGLNSSKPGLNSSKPGLNSSKSGVNDSKHYQTPKKVKFVLKNNSMQKPIDYFKSVRQSPNIPFDGTKKPVKTNLKPSTPSPINPFFKKKLRLTF